MSESGFEVHTQLAQDCLEVGDFPLCRVMLMNDARFPWFILIPRRGHLAEIHQLKPEDRAQLWDESHWLSQKLQMLYRPDKLNIAAIGNLVPQLHVHHIVRYVQDSVWPAPVWGKGRTKTYDEVEAEQRIYDMRELLRQYKAPA